MMQKDRKFLYGISPIISVVILIALIFTIAAVVGPWMYELTTRTTNETGSDVERELLCRNTAYDFYTDYGTHGVSWNNTQLKVRIVNTGSVNLYDFSFEVIVNSSIIRNFNVTSATQRTQANQLRPSQTAILEAEDAENISGSIINEVKILNAVCPSVYVSQEL